MKRTVHLTKVNDYRTEWEDQIQIRIFDSGKGVETMNLTPKEALNLSFKLKALALDMVD